MPKQCSNCGNLCVVKQSSPQAKNPNRKFWGCLNPPCKELTKLWNGWIEPSEPEYNQQPINQQQGQHRDASPQRRPQQFQQQNYQAPPQQFQAPQQFQTPQQFSGGAGAEYAQYGTQHAPQANPQANPGHGDAVHIHAKLNAIAQDMAIVKARVEEMSKTLSVQMDFNKSIGREFLELKALVSGNLNVETMADYQ